MLGLNALVLLLLLLDVSEAHEDNESADSEESALPPTMFSFIRKGNRPDFVEMAETPDLESVKEEFVNKLMKCYIPSHRHLPKIILVYLSRTWNEILTMDPANLVTKRILLNKDVTECYRLLNFAIDYYYISLLHETLPSANVRNDGGVSLSDIGCLKIMHTVQLYYGHLLKQASNLFPHHHPMNTGHWVHSDNNVTTNDFFSSISGQFLGDRECARKVLLLIEYYSTLLNQLHPADPSTKTGIHLDRNVATNDYISSISGQGLIDSANVRNYGGLLINHRECLAMIQKVEQYYLYQMNLVLNIYPPNYSYFDKLPTDDDISSIFRQFLGDTECDRKYIQSRMIDLSTVLFSAHADKPSTKTGIHLDRNVATNDYISRISGQGLIDSTKSANVRIDGGVFLGDRQIDPALKRFNDCSLKGRNKTRPAPNDCYWKSYKNRDKEFWGWWGEVGPDLMYAFDFVLYNNKFPGMRENQFWYLISYLITLAQNGSVSSLTEQMSATDINFDELEILVSNLEGIVGRLAG